MIAVLKDQPELTIITPSQKTAALGSSKSETQTFIRTSLERDLEGLARLALPALQKRCREVYGQMAPNRLGAEFLRRAIGYRLQELALGSLSRQAQLRLKTLNQKVRQDHGTVASSSLPSLVKPGTRFVREWKGETHEVVTLENGSYAYRGRTFRSLTVITRTITGAHQSGPRFFGLGRRGGKSTNLEQADG